MEEKYRNCVGIIVVGKGNKVLLCERKDFPEQWQFPQGGIEPGETALAAARRELREETSIVSVEPIAQLQTALRYHFPPNIKKSSKWQYAGQDIQWVMFRLTGSESEINLQTEEPEFRSFCWTDISQAPKKIVEFKREVYIKAVEYFKPIIGE